MRDKRPVDELTIEELEKVLAIRKREEREKRLERMKRAGRVVSPEVQAPPVPTAPIPQIPGVTVPPVPEMPRPQPVMAAAAPAASYSTAPEFEDEQGTMPAAERSRFWRSFVNQSLLLVEGLAVVGLLFLGYQMITATNQLQTETANAQALANQQRATSLPTLAPTPQIQLRDVVLPGGHVFDANGQVQFAINEIPESLRGLVSEQILVPIAARPQPTSETAIEINIPSLGINQTIVQGTDWEALKLGVGQLLNGVNPGDDAGNLVLSGHNDVYGEIFRHIDELKPGDEFNIRTRTQLFTYRISGSQIVNPTDVDVLGPRGGATATLISCYPYKVNDKRYIVFAERVNT
ncbi:MAG: sortase [Anaerolineae bacterium]